MIAHRLTTIASADNLLYFKSRSQLVSAEKGSPEYEEIFEKLKCIQYARGDDDGEENKDALDGEDFEDGVDIIEESNASMEESDTEIERVKAVDVQGAEEDTFSFQSQSKRNTLT